MCLASQPCTLPSDRICLLRHPLWERGEAQGDARATSWLPHPLVEPWLFILALCVFLNLRVISWPREVFEALRLDIHFMTSTSWELALFLKSRSMGHHSGTVIHHSGGIDLGCSSLKPTTVYTRNSTLQGQIWVTHFLDLCLLTPPPNIRGSLQWSTQVQRELWNKIKKLNLQGSMGGKKEGDNYLKFKLNDFHSWMSYLILMFFEVRVQKETWILYLGEGEEGLQVGIMTGKVSSGWIKWFFFL